MQDHYLPQYTDIGAVRPDLRSIEPGRECPPWAVAGGIFLGLTALLRLPDLLLGTLPFGFSAEAWAFYWEGPLRVFSLDLLALVCLLAVVPRAGRGRYGRAFVVGSLFILLAYETYGAVVGTILHRDPLLYADVSHVVGAVYLLYNAVSTPQLIAGALATVGLIGVLVWLLPFLVEHLHRALETRFVRAGLLGGVLVVGSLVTFAALTGRGIERQTYQEICLSTTECLVHNVKASLSLKRDLQRRRRRPPDSTYRRYWTLDWRSPPSVYLVVLESYGMALATAEETRRRYQRRMAQTSRVLRRGARVLGRDGWHAATARSVAPVVGGLSWLSVATLFLGTPIERQPTFEVLRPHLPRYPHLVRLFERQGYATAALQPPVRARPALSVGNPYGFDHTFYFRDLNYDGPSYGWGIVPDQYSLSVAHDRFVETTDAPFFLFFETVTPHGPWHRQPPPLVEEVSVLNHSKAEARAAPLLSGTSSSSVAGEGQSSGAARLLRHIEYDWHVLANYLRTEAPPNSLVVVLGDHQPYIAGQGSAATPVHVLSRDEQLIRRFEEYGFTSGLRPSGSRRVHHAGLYSMLVRILTVHDRAERSRSGTISQPPYHPRGVKRAAFLPERP